MPQRFRPFGADGECRAETNQVSERPIRSRSKENCSRIPPWKWRISTIIERKYPLKVCFCEKSFNSTRMPGRESVGATSRTSSYAIPPLNAGCGVASSATTPRIAAGAESDFLACLQSNWRAAGFAANSRCVAIADNGCRADSYATEARPNRRTRRPHAQHEQQFLAGQLPSKRPVPVPGAPGGVPIFSKSIP